ncbi:hypothetical protein CGCSCA4_v005236 [Colletotrichum siamense]|uniref:Alpha-ketoglutarate-dependent sulfonate dioxygenase n=1 Tax=Colletotrichum siamense TaxID=690259 RepID=A0A9P5EVL5_COLSI|nr:hypothetical protein CGCSCA4_v005236 [Colletotrichum siamense]KAF4860988.1 hypothetical protein CGCSCA2_v004698 [Colletotrichum siamense]
MPSFFKRSKKEKEKEAEAEAEKAKAERAATPPPTYEDAQTEPPAFEDQPPSFESINGSKGGARPPPTEAEVANLTAAFSSLRLGTQRDPDVDSCLAHLKLLFAIQTLKEEVGYTDGLWEIWDTRAGPKPDSEEAGSSKKSEDYVKDVLAKLREKRWAVFLARAVDRYETWWLTLAGERLKEEDMKVKSEKYLEFPDGGNDFPWTLDILPPLDVLMIWHAHMLNPRAFLEDTMRYGMKTFWTTGMPWAQVNEIIDAKFNYIATDAAKANWEASTGRAWDNVAEPLAKYMECPVCKETIEVPWTTCGLPELYKGEAKPGLVGKGYGDGELFQLCTAGCNTIITRRFLSVAKMLSDAEHYLADNHTVPSTVLEPKVGMPVPQANGNAPLGQAFRETTFPNRLLGFGVIDELRKLVRPGLQKPPTMEDVRDIIQVTLEDNDAHRRIQELDKKPLNKVLPRTERVQSKKMMSRYWDNYSIFALDLVGATVRQGVFVEKMYNIDWLHGPNQRGTMDRLLQKYSRFMLIMTENPYSLCVPTLDVDLAWHTHQLAPRAYYKFSTFNSATTGTKEARFIDHNDKIDEERLTEAFEWSSRTYLDKFNEVYSECVCGWCDIIRTNHTINDSSIFGRTKQQKTIDNFNASAKPSAPGAEVHISAHNAVLSKENGGRKALRYQQRQICKHRMDGAYERAAKRASKKGVKLPKPEEYYNHWGSTYHRYGPNMYPAHLTAGIYVAADPGIMHAGTGSWAGCAQGLCGSNDIAAGGCGGPGGCSTSDGVWAGRTPNQMGGCGAYAGSVVMISGGGCGGGGGGCGGGS